MWLKTQKVLKFIPIVNFISVISWLVVGIKRRLGAAYFVKNVVIMGALALLLIMLGRGVSSLFQSVDVKHVVLLICAVFYTYISAFIAVNEQEGIQNGKYDTQND